MQGIKWILLLATAFASYASMAQAISKKDEVDIKSYALYEKGAWKELLQYGKDAVQGQDFVLLRLRMAYAAYMLGNFSEAIKQYDAVLQSDDENITAHYYIWLCRKYLNQTELAGTQIKYLSEEAVAEAKLKKVALTKAGIETSYKYTDTKPRGNSIYSRLDIGLGLGWNVNMIQSGGIYNQTISETQFQAVKDSNKIVINQKEYYNRTTINVNSNWQVKLAYHYLQTPFNNYSYNNHVGLFGIKYSGYYFDVQADAIYSKLTDSTHQQYDVKLGLYPMGNLNFYSFTTGSLRTYNGNQFNIKQVIGFKIMKNTWAEVNGTFGRFSNLMENDALYVYNAIDINKIKVGGVLYVTLSPHILAQAGYTFEQREFYNKTTSFNQHSITGGLSWKM